MLQAHRHAVHFKHILYFGEGQHKRNIEVLRYNIRFHGVKLIHREMTGLLNKELETYRIYSMSKRFNNMALWAKYADEHRG